MVTISVKLLVIYLYSTINFTWSQDELEIVQEEWFDWCCLKCNGPHLMCPAALEQRKLSRPEGCSSLRGNRTAVGIFSEETLVALINQRRSKLARNAKISNMQHLRISYKLTNFAEHLAGYCNSIPSVCVDTDDYEVKVLTFNVTGDQVNVTMSMVVDYWMRGRIPYLKQLYHDELYTNYSSIIETDDFTLLMWGTTGEIGCAEAYYYNTTLLYDDNTTASGNYSNSNNTTTSEQDNTTLSYQITCLLGPGGNINGTAMWDRGDPCSNCSTILHSRGYCRDSLCYSTFPRWPRDEERLASCISEFTPSIEGRLFVRDDDQPYANGVTVLLKPRYICDPISAAGIPTSKLQPLTFILN